MSDRLAVMRAGEIDQIGTPRDVYDQPATAYVADFLGLANLLPATVGAAGRVTIGGKEMAADTRDVMGVCTVLVRPERVRLVPSGTGVLAARVQHLVFAGPVTHVHLAVGDQTLQAVISNDGGELLAREGEPVDVELSVDSLRVLAG
jgi:spermidine/putrescine transport system ATP-binding protein